MSRKRPNTLFWRRTMTALGVIYGKSARRGGEKLFDLERGKLRARIDCNLSDAQRAHYEELLAAALRQHVGEARAKSEEAERAAAMFDRDSVYRRAGYMGTATDRTIDYLVDLGFEEREAA
ncbi:hypothetical protein BSZ19_18555 [Bradyrhizobium japonicum]|uniref:Uncharacterized protein n=1 Tax=Bradyrhizobium japonicum TaxID=375 RepID=A0A1Y2JNP9_BRAJP|nr:hypothetical protein [Bradyrhizobium japonicum]OSJ32553.1 hypothetical protein BSZ19_18555 [Bradyrhizobium japonicum]